MNKTWTISVVASILLVMGAFAALFGTGYRFFVVQTPSMGTDAPVGTLVAVHAKQSYQVGDVVTYERKSRSYTHRIVDITDQGFVTKGDINEATDALPVQPSEIVGLVTFRARYLGFVAEGLPWIIIGCALVYGLTLLPRVRPSWRWQIRFVGWSLVISLVALRIRPWVNLVMMGYTPLTDGVAMHLVNTGVFPVNVLGTVLQSGQDAVVQQTAADSSGHYTVIPQLALTGGWFLLLLAICLTPMLASLLIRIEDPTGDVVEPIAESRPQRLRRLGVLAVIVTSCVVLVAIVLQWSTHAAFAASIKNSTNNAVTRTWFKCQNAEVGTAARFVWGLTATGTQTDLTTHGLNGTMTTNGTAAAPSSSSPCVRDTQGSVMFNGGTCFYQGTAVTVAQVYSMEVWFRTSNTSLNGKLMGLADNTTPNLQSHYDRHIYIDPTGRVVFGAYVTGQMVVASSSGTNYANGSWHHVVATSSATSIALYIDGVLVSSRSDTANQDSYSGYWMVGCGQLADWQDATGVARNFSDYYTGNMRLAAVYDATLTATQVKEHYLAGVA